MPQPVKILADTVTPFLNANPERDPHVAATRSGSFAIAWTTDSPAGDADSVTFFRVNGNSAGTTDARDERHASLAVLADDRLVAAFTHDHAAGNEQVESVTLAPGPGGGTASIELFPGEAGNQNRPEVVALANGRYAYVWMDTVSSEIRGAIYNAVGGVVGAAFDIAANMQIDSPYDLGLVALPNGGFAVTYDNATSGASLVIVSAAGVAGAPIDFDTGVTANFDSDVTLLADGRLVMVAYTSSGYRARFFNTDGTPDGASFEINNTGGNTAAVTALNDGRFLVVLDRSGNIYGQMVKADGTLDGAEFQVNTEAGGSQTRPHLATLADGRIVIAWEDDRTGVGDIYYNIWDPREAGLYAAASGLPDEWVGTTFGDTIFGAAGNDNLAGGNGNDYLFGEGDQDTLNGDAGNDRIYGGNGNDIINGGGDADGWLGGDAGADTINGGDGNDRIDGGAGNDQLFGDADNDTITGGTGNDIVDGGTGNDLVFGDAGNDSLTAGAGNDSLRGGDGNDTLFGGSDADSYLGGENGDDTVFGGLGNDRVDGGIGNDELHGDDDIDFITGGDGNDLVFGGTGNDILQGNNGNDTLRGELGRDSLTGGAGNDAFSYYAADFADGLFETIFDFSEVAGSNFDTLVLEGVAGNYSLIDGAGFVRVIHTASGGSVYVNNMTAATLFDQIVFF